MKRPGVEKCISEKDCDDHRVKVNEIGLNIHIKCYKLQFTSIIFVFKKWIHLDLNITLALLQIYICLLDDYKCGFCADKGTSSS